MSNVFVCFSHLAAEDIQAGFHIERKEPSPFYMPVLVFLFIKNCDVVNFLALKSYKIY
jgi:hypothetical protein